ncbi:hypothetical protein Tco_1381378 [Tanacetum coccineum]
MVTSSRSTSHHVLCFMTRTMTITRSIMMPEAIEELINQRVAEALAVQEANRNVEHIVGSENQYGDEEGDSNGGGNGNGNGRENGTVAVEEMEIMEMEITVGIDGAYEMS